jgi:hypothetical protein
VATVGGNAPVTGGQAVFCCPVVTAGTGNARRDKPHCQSLSYSAAVQGLPLGGDRVGI